MLKKANIKPMLDRSGHDRRRGVFGVWWDRLGTTTFELAALSWVGTSLYDADGKPREKTCIARAKYDNDSIRFYQVSVHL